MKELLLPIGCFLMLGFAFACRYNTTAITQEYKAEPVEAVCPEEKYWKKYIPCD